MSHTITQSLTSVNTEPYREVWQPTICRRPCKNKYSLSRERCQGRNSPTVGECAVRPYLFLDPTRRHPIAQTTTTNETSTTNPIMTIFSTGAALTTTALNATTGTSPALTIAF